MSKEEYITEGVSSSPSGSCMYSHDETADLEDYFNLELSVTVVETEADEIDNEFVDAVTEIEGKKFSRVTIVTKYASQKVASQGTKTQNMPSRTT